MAAGGNQERRASLDELVTNLKTLVERVHEDLRRRLGTVRTHMALIRRFKNRCEWHDRDRLRKIAEASSAPEEDLTAELVRWLFDQGLSPLTKPRTGGLEPDVLDPSFRPTLYVEAKRYRASRHARSHIRRGVQQVQDTAARLHGTPYEIHEVFLVVFREGGPRYVLPEMITGDAWTIYPLLIDIAPSEQTGSRQRERVISIPLDDLAPTTHSESG
jgi:hypothetical protein